MTWMKPVGLAVFSLALAACTVYGQTVTDDPFETVNLTAPDGSIRARFLRLGATPINLWVPDKNGVFRDVLLGNDNLTDYRTYRTFFGPVVGRYANRIRNGTFTIPISTDASGNGTKYHTPLNENNVDTLHGGFNGYDQRVWNITKQSKSSVTFSMIDPDGTEGFPGTVLVSVTYDLLKKSTWNISMNALATAETPLMLSGHHYWNLEAYKETQGLVGHYAQFQASKYIATDGILIPTGQLKDVAGTPMDFHKAKSIGEAIIMTTPFQFCGTNCTGFDNAWIYDHHDDDTTVLSVWSKNSGIKLDVKTNQPALQIYTCNGITASARPKKADQGGPAAGNYTDHSCFVLEQESYIDAVNHPEWGINPLYGPTRPYHWQSTYTFSILT